MFVFYCIVHACEVQFQLLISHIAGCIGSSGFWKHLINVVFDIVLLNMIRKFNLSSDFNWLSHTSGSGE